MAQLVLTAASSVGAAVGRAGIGAAIARSVASTAVAYASGAAERLLFGPRKRKVTGPRLDSFQIQSSSEGASVLRVYGRARVSGELIWAANFKETVSETTERSGKGGRLGTKTTITDYLYSISFAVGLCEGVIDRIARVWADGKPFDLSPYNVRVYRGTEDQLPDAAIEAVEGAAPAFRGLAYVVFEDLPLRDFGNRIPQLSFEIEKSLRQEDPDALENAVTAATLIPGSGEFVYGTTRVLKQASEGATTAENAHNNDGVSDFVSSLDALQAALPNLEAVSLVVSWFGNDLRAGSCALRPGVELADKTTTPYDWKAGGVARAGAHLVSTIAGAPAYGGSPADRCVLEAIAALKARGLEVMVHPFLLMDIPAGNGLPDPYGGSEQAAYPWRGRITVGANDKTAAAANDIAAFFGSAAPAHFSIAGGEVVYAGPAEWSFRRFILHYAKLCALAGGVDRFLIGSELRGLTRARSDATAFPAVAALKSLAADVKAILPAAQISYGADWSEYFGHQPADGSGDVFFHLDPLWSDPSISFVGIDNYVPLADWRDGFSHLDAAAGFGGPYDRAYLQANIEGGENYDWYYASPEDRAAQARTPIADGAYGEPWVYRAKDFRNWWARAHYNRPGGVRAPAPTGWVPEMKPIVFTETGAPAVDKAANAPNLFVDPKSAESALPPFSSGARDDLAQRRAIEAAAAYWRANNALSSVDGRPMIETERAFVYCWDARPYPFFPALSGVWGDAANWEKGQWLNGRAGRAPLDLLVAALAAGTGAAVDTRGLKGVLAGYVLDR
ncbi:MAG: glycoside hydrolase TIM-barrel-like domain-containing protein, partial [Amphiplicatus sp.]